MAALLKGAGIDAVPILAQVPGRDRALLGADLGRPPAGPPAVLEGEGLVHRLWGQEVITGRGGLGRHKGLPIRPTGNSLGDALKIYRVIGP